MGRPSILTPELEDRILKFIRTGVPLEVAAQASGVSPSTFWDWMAAGEGKPSKVEATDRLRRFSEKVRTTENETHALFVGSLRVAAVTNGDWKAAAAYLRMRWSRYYAERTEVSGPGGEPLLIVQDHERVLLRKAIDEYLSAHPEESEGPTSERLTADVDRL